MTRVYEEKVVRGNRYSQTLRAHSLVLLACATSMACAGCGPSPPIPPEPKPSQAMPMNVIFFEENQILPTLSVRLHTDDGGLTEPQTLLVDTGSSSMAFCDSSLAASVKASRIPYLWCQQYLSKPPGGANGWVHEATMDVESFKNKKGFYAIMENRFSMPCSSQVHGIFGVAYKSGNVAEQRDKVTPLPKWNMTEIEKNGAPACPIERKEALPYSNMQKWLSEDGAEKKRFGIHWSGKLGAAEASLYYGDAAVANPHYDSRIAQKAKMSNLPSANKPQGFGTYSVDVTSFTLRTGNESFTWDLMNFGPSKNQSFCALEGGKCILDTGTKNLGLFSQFASEDWIAKHPKVTQQGAGTALAKAAEVCNSLPSQASGSIEFELAPPSGATKPAKLAFDLDKLCPTFSVKNSTGISFEPQIAFGWPAWLQNYIVFDIFDNSTTIVPLHRPSMRGASPSR